MKTILKTQFNMVAYKVQYFKICTDVKLNDHVYCISASTIRNRIIVDPQFHDLPKINSVTRHTHCLSRSPSRAAMD